MFYASHNRSSWYGRLAGILFPTPMQAAISLATIAVCLWCAWFLSEWLVINAVFSGSAEECRAAMPHGACWAGVLDKIEFIIIGRYSSAEAWRPQVVVALFALVMVACYFRFSWGLRMALMWYVFIFLSHVILGGGVFGLRPVPADQWGGFALTIVLASSGLGIALPVGILLALARRSRLPLIRSLATGYIELVRGVPLVAVLFLTSVMLPLVLPEAFSPTKVGRACTAIGFFAAAYIAEVVRGGLQTIPAGQQEAARALGMNYVAATLTVVLPQALRVTVPPIMNTMIAIFKDTSLVITIGLIDFLGVVRLITIEPEWRLFYLEPLIFAGVVYFLFCWYMSRVAFRIERSLLKSTMR
ncbi:MAG TPA: amino acid ABC transporter permease [Pusillimonas sp.]|uniref:amino acid ABC transporter permease n=1 Tax=Pusillimonas sp. TaxID=3040095 RepID=UPI002B4B3EF8|nr:amino acid ABC transporter permease [Pusillimonas sp.]HLU20480.1 amino acid ABC transporter permease [Pusillimonas sp.]